MDWFSWCSLLLSCSHVHLIGLQWETGFHKSCVCVCMWVWVCFCWCAWEAEKRRVSVQLWKCFTPPQLKKYRRVASPSLNHRWSISQYKFIAIKIHSNPLISCLYLSRLHSFFSLFLPLQIKQEEWKRKTKDAERTPSINSLHNPTTKQ